MKKLLSNKKMLVLICVFGLLLLAGCQRNVDGQGNVLPERIIYLDTPWSAMLNESILTAILVYPLAQIINFIGNLTGSGVLGVVLTTLLYNALTIVLSIKSTVNSQKMQMIQPEIKRIERKYEGRDDENSKMRMAAEQQQLFRKYDINPASMLLVTFIQLPVIMAIFYAVQRSYAVQTGTFLGMNLQTSPMQGLQEALAGNSASWMYLVLFAFMAVCQVLSIKIPSILQKRREAEIAKKTHRRPPEKEENNMMQYSMILMILVFGFSWPAAMSLYWSINSLVNVLKTIIVQKVIDSKDMTAKKGYGR